MENITVLDKGIDLRKPVKGVELKHMLNIKDPIL